MQNSSLVAAINDSSTPADLKVIEAQITELTNLVYKRNNELAEAKRKRREEFKAEYTLEVRLAQGKQNVVLGAIFLVFTMTEASKVKAKELGVSEDQFVKTSLAYFWVPFNGSNGFIISKSGGWVVLKDPADKSKYGDSFDATIPCTLDQWADIRRGQIPPEMLSIRGIVVKS